MKYYTVSALFVERRSLRNLFGLLNRFHMIDVGYQLAWDQNDAKEKRKRFITGLYSFSTPGVSVMMMCASEVPFYIVNSDL